MFSISVVSCWMLRYGPLMCGLCLQINVNRETYRWVTVNRLELPLNILMGFYLYNYFYLLRYRIFIFWPLWPWPLPGKQIASRSSNLLRWRGACVMSPASTLVTVCGQVNDGPRMYCSRFVRVTMSPVGHVLSQCYDGAVILWHDSGHPHAEYRLREMSNAIMSVYCSSEWKIDC